MVSRDRFVSFRKELIVELTGNILPYWTEKMVDHEFGGFYGRRDGYDALVGNADKGVILNTRILWTFSSAARHIDKHYLPPATRAYDYLVDHFIDHTHGGVFWMLDYRGNPLQTKKQIYAQAFAIYALAEYHAASHDAASLRHAQDLFRLVERHSFDTEFNGYLEAYDREWSLLEDLRLSDKDANEKKTMNTHLHVLEAYTSLLRVWPDETLRRQLKNLIQLFKERIINDRYHFDLFFDERWNVRSTEVSYGHDIEGSWLLHDAALAVGEEVLSIETAALSVRIAEATLREGVDSEGAVANEAHDPDRHWWPQAEAMVGFVNSWQVTGQTSYLVAAFRVWDFIRARLIDKKNGEWYWRVDPAGAVNYTEDKAGPWKCPYHNGRAMIELLRRIPEADDLRTQST